MTSSEMSRAGIRREQVWDIVLKPHWGGALDIDDVEGRIIAEELTVAALADLDRLIDLVSREPGQTADAVCIGKLTAGWSLIRLWRTRRAMWRLFEAHPLLRELDLAISARSDKKVRRPYPQRPRQFSVFPEQLPGSMQDALQNMGMGIPGDSGTVPVPTMITTTRTKLCEWAKAAQDAGLAVEMTVAAATAYERSLVRREKPLSPKTVLSAIRQIRDFARYVGVEESVLDHFAWRIRVHENRSAHYTPQKEAKVLALPDYAGIFGLALDMLGRAAHVPNPKSAQQLRNGAVAITLFCPFPLRVADTLLRFGQDILWDGAGYRFNLIISKTQRPFSAPVLPVFGWFIDQLILQGAGPEHLDDLRAACFSRERALFVNYNNTEPHVRYVSHLWRQFLGTGNHAARTHLHDSFGHMGARGVELAMRACGHRSEKTAEAYRTRAFERLALERIHQDLVADILDEEWKHFFGKPAATNVVDLGCAPV